MASLTLETAPVLEDLDAADSDAADRIHPSSYVTPLMPAIPSASRPGRPGLDAETLSLLRDARFLIDTVLGLPAEPTPWQLHKLNSTLNWVEKRVTASHRELARPSVNPRTRDSPPCGDQDAPNSPGVASDPPLSSDPGQRDGADADPGDALHGAVALAARLYSRAIGARRPLGAVVSRAAELLERVWRVPLATWRGGGDHGLLGVLLWMQIAVLPAVRAMPSGFAGGSMVMAAALQMGLADRPGTRMLLRRAARLGAWLRGGPGEDGEVDG